MKGFIAVLVVAGFFLAIGAHTGHVDMTGPHHLGHWLQQQTRWRS